MTDAEHKKEYWQRMLPNLVLLMILLSLFVCLHLAMIITMIGEEL